MPGVPSDIYSAATCCTAHAISCVYSVLRCGVGADSGCRHWGQALQMPALRRPVCAQVRDIWDVLRVV